MSINQRQNQSENIKLLAAQRNIYSRSKTLIGIQIFLSIPIALCAVVAVAIWPGIKGHVAIWGILVIVSDLYIFTPWIKNLRDSAARIQEVFDTNVLCIGWNDISVGKRPDPETVHNEADKYGMNGAKCTTLENWYPEAIDTVPEVIGKIICQRANLWWDASMRRNYSLVIRIILVGVALLVIGYGLYAEAEMFYFLAYIVAPLAAMYVFGYRQMTEHLEAADRLDNLRELSEKIWGKALDGENEAEINNLCRKLQDLIFIHRKNNPPIFDFLFILLRDKNEILMNKSAETLIAEYDQFRQ